MYLGPGITLGNAPDSRGGMEKLREERREEAARRAKANLVLDRIIKVEKIRLLKRILNSV